MGNRQAMAEELHVHPQTVRYRMAQLRELFGQSLDDPRTRAVLLLALAWGPAAEESIHEQAGGWTHGDPAHGEPGHGHAAHAGRDR
jgi:DNA-binding transcriptional LysR family regulator